MSAPSYAQLKSFQSHFNIDPLAPAPREGTLYNNAAP